MIELNKLYEEDALNTMGRMPDAFLDLTVTSPPYDKLRAYKDGIGEEWGEHIWKLIIAELYRVAKKGGIVVWVVSDATIDGNETGTAFKQALWAKECGFNLHDTMIYYKEGMTLNHNRYEQEFEYMFIFSKGKPKTFNPIIVPCKLFGKDGDRIGQKYGKHDEINKRSRSGKDRSTIKSTKIKGNIWKYNTGYLHSTREAEAFKHPAIFPEKLAEDHILSWSNEGDIVYDPMAGSGTTLKMALIHSRKYIGSEKVPEYCKIINSRLDKYIFLG